MSETANNGAGNPASTTPNTSPPDAAVKPAQGYTPEQMAGIRERFIARGGNAEIFDRTMAGGDTAAPIGNDGVIVNADPGKPNAMPPITREQAKSASERLLKAGVAPEKIQEALAAAGFGDLYADQRDEAGVEHDNAFGFSPEGHQPTDYKIKYPQNILAQGPAKVAAINAAITEGLSDLGIEPAIGVHLVEHGYQLAAQHRAMSDTQKALWKQQQRADLVRSCGGQEKADEEMHYAGVALKLLEKTTLGEAMAAAPAFGKDVWSIKTLANYGRRLAQWSATRPGGAKGL